MHMCIDVEISSLRILS